MPGRQRALAAAATLAWCAEAVLARISGQPQRPVHLLLAALFAAALAFGAAAASRMPIPGLRGPGRHGVDVALPSAAWAAALLMIAMQPGASASTTLVAGAVAGTVTLALGALAPARASGSLPFVAIGGAALAAWLLRGALPPATMLAALFGCFLLLRALAALPRGPAWAALAAAAIALAPAGLGPTLVPLGLGAEATKAAGPDLVLITTDTLRADTAAAMQSFRRLRARGRSYDAQSSSTWTLPSFASIHTGFANERHGAGKFAGKAHAVNAELPTLAEDLAGAGYDTAAVLAYNPWLAPDYGFARGFAHYDHGNSGARAWALPSYGNHSRRGSLPVAAYATWAGLQAFALEGLAVPLELWLWDRADDVVARAERVLAQRGTRPLFLWVHFMDVHIPYRHVLENPSIPTEVRRALVRYDGNLGGWIAEQSDGDAIRDHVRSAYEYEARKLDAALGRLIDAIDRDARDPIILWTADHGEELWEHGKFGHGHAFFQEIIGVPLVIAGAIDGLTPAPHAGLIDVAPTLRSAAGLESKASDGASLFVDAAPRAYVTQNLHHPQPDPSREKYASDHWYAVRERDWKWMASGGHRALFDLASDPGESDDRSAAHPARAEALQAYSPRARASGTAPEIDASTRDALRALGYAE